MANSSDVAMVGNAEALLGDGYRVLVGRAGVEELIEIDRIYIAQDTDVVCIVAAGAGPMDQLYFAPGQIAVVKGIDVNDLSRSES